MGGGFASVLLKQRDPTQENFLAWLEFAKLLRGFGLCIEVSDFLEERASEAQKKQGIDLVVFLFGSKVPGFPDV